MLRTHLAGRKSWGPSCFSPPLLQVFICYLDVFYGLLSWSLLFPAWCLLCLAVTEHASHALDLSKKQEQTRQMEFQAQIKVCGDCFLFGCNLRMRQRSLLTFRHPSPTIPSTANCLIFGLRNAHNSCDQILTVAAAQVRIFECIQCTTCYHRNETQQT